jgi:putative SOS response-associated peptidase YedK
MCNTYTIKAKIAASPLEEAVSAAARRRRSPLVRRTDPGVVVVKREGELVVETMRWGFATPKYNSVNNARSETLKRGMWRKPMEDGRCLVPMSTFYEWKELGPKLKQPYEFSRPDGDWLWIAGLWETNEQYGPSYATITTAPTPRVEPIHDRLLAIVEWEQGLQFLSGGDFAFTPYAGDLAIEPCESPLKRKASGDQGGLL